MHVKLLFKAILFRIHFKFRQSHIHAENKKPSRIHNMFSLMTV